MLVLRLISMKLQQTFATNISITKNYNASLLFQAPKYSVTLDCLLFFTNNCDKRSSSGYNRSKFPKFRSHKFVKSYKFLVAFDKPRLETSTNCTSFWSSSSSLIFSTNSLPFSRLTSAMFQHL